MLTDGRITCFNSVSRPTISRRLFSVYCMSAVAISHLTFFSRSFLPSGNHIFHKILFIRRKILDEKEVDRQKRIQHEESKLRSLEKRVCDI